MDSDQLREIEENVGRARTDISKVLNAARVFGFWTVVLLLLVLWRVW